MEDKTMINLGAGFECEIIKTIPDKLGADLEGYLYYLGEVIPDYKSNKQYKTERGLVNHMVNVILPSYIANVGKKAYSIKYFREQNAVYEFVHEYITNNEINWGVTLDVVEILESYGYIMPKHTDSGFSVDEYIEYLNIVTEISLEFTKHLKSFGFGADRNNSNRKGHPHKEKHLKCMNLVFTRYPWTSAYKIIKTVMSFLSISGRNFFAGQDNRKFKKQDPEAYEFVQALIEFMKDIHVETNTIVSKTGFRKAAMNFVEYMDEHSDELYAKYQQMRPVGYGEYK